MMQAIEALTREDHQVILDVLLAEEAELVIDMESVGGYQDAAFFTPEVPDRLAAIRRVLAWW